MPRFPSEPTEKDRRRYYASKSGRSVEEIAKDEDVGVGTVENSISRVRTEYQKYTTEETGVAIRRALFDMLPLVKKMFHGALNATMYVDRKVFIEDPETHEKTAFEESIEVPDHHIRLKGAHAFSELLAVVQPKDPAIVVNANTQNNILNQTMPGMPGQLSSPEAVIRQIRQERGYALTDGKAEAVVPVDAEEVDEEDESGEDDDEFAEEEE